MMGGKEARSSFNTRKSIEMRCFGANRCVAMIGLSESYEILISLIKTLNSNYVSFPVPAINQATFCAFPLPPLSAFELKSNKIIACS